MSGHSGFQSFGALGFVLLSNSSREREFKVRAEGLDGRPLVL